jgi:hypothetical protein
MIKENLLRNINLIALIIYIIGRVFSLPILMYLGIVLMVIGCILTLIHWKENSNTSNYIAIAFLILVGISFFF